MKFQLFTLPPKKNPNKKRQPKKKKKPEDHKQKPKEGNKTQTKN